MKPTLAQKLKWSISIGIAATVFTIPIALVTYWLYHRPFTIKTPLAFGAITAAILFYLYSKGQD